MTDDFAAFYEGFIPAAPPGSRTVRMICQRLLQPTGRFWRWYRIMHRLFVTLCLWLTLVFSAHGVSLEIPVTTTNLDQYKYRFSVSTNATNGGVAFHVIVTAKKEDIHPDSKIGLSIVTHTKTRDGETHSIASVKPEIPLRVKKDKRVWEADFTVSYELLEKPGLCFVFTEIAHATTDGKSVAMPSADFYEIKLRDFLKQ